MSKLDSSLELFLQRRLIATIATQNEDRSIHMTAVWYLYENGRFFIATSSKSRKARNAAARSSASLMIDSRTPGKERGTTATGTIAILTGAASAEINHRIQSRYLSPAALADPSIGGFFATFDDVTLQLTPDSWISWDMAALDAQVFGGRLGGTPGYMLPLD